MDEDGLDDEDHLGLPEDRWWRHPSELRGAQAGGAVPATPGDPEGPLTPDQTPDLQPVHAAGGEVAVFAAGPFSLERRHVRLGASVGASAAAAALVLTALTPAPRTTNVIASASFAPAFGATSAPDVATFLQTATSTPRVTLVSTTVSPVEPAPVVDAPSTPSTALAPMTTLVTVIANQSTVDDQAEGNNAEDLELRITITDELPVGAPLPEALVVPPAPGGTATEEPDPALAMAEPATDATSSAAGTNPDGSAAAPATQIQWPEPDDAPLASETLAAASLPTEQFTFAVFRELASVGVELGLKGNDHDDQPGTLAVSQVQAGSWAAQVGLREGDDLYAVNGYPMMSISSEEPATDSTPTDGSATEPAAGGDAPVEETPETANAETTPSPDTDTDTEQAAPATPADSAVEPGSPAVEASPFIAATEAEMIASAIISTRSGPGGLRVAFNRQDAVLVIRLPYLSPAG